MTDLKSLDPRNLIFESYRIDGITEGECRSIFLDWAIGVPAGQDSRDWVRQLHAHYAPLHPDHPMTRVLTDGMEQAASARRRGGRAGRLK